MVVVVAVDVVVVDDESDVADVLDCKCQHRMIAVVVAAVVEAAD